MLVDKYNRPLTHLRISVTSRCNYMCFFCHREGEGRSSTELSVGEIALVCRVARKLGIRFFKITGGEPLLRKDIEHIVRNISQLEGAEVSLVTNGYFLKEKVKSLIEAGLSRANISLHSLNEEVYKAITKVNGLKKVIEGIKNAVDYGLRIKLNTVILNELNHEEYVKIIDFASNIGADVCFIELIPLGIDPREYRKYHVSLKYIKNYLRKHCVKEYTRELQNRPVYVFSTGIKVELVESYGNPNFCLKCRKIRLTHDGKLKPCLMRNDNTVSLIHVIKSDMTLREKEKALERLFIKANSLREPFFK